MSAALLALALAAGAGPAEEEQSILLDGSYRLQGILPLLPTAGSVHSLLENVAQPVVFQIEEGAGFSDIDPAKLSIYGDSWVWNRWYLDGFDITDPATSGAPAFQVPFSALSALEVTYRETPENLREQGVRLHLGGMAPRVTVRISTSVPSRPHSTQVRPSALAKSTTRAGTPVVPGISTLTATFAGMGSSKIRHSRAAPDLNQRDGLER